MICLCGGKRWLPIFRCLYLPILQAMFSPNIATCHNVTCCDLMSVRHPSPLVSFFLLPTSTLPRRSSSGPTTTKSNLLLAHALYPPTLDALLPLEFSPSLPFRALELANARCWDRYLPLLLTYLWHHGPHPTRTIPRPPRLSSQSLTKLQMK